MKRKNQVKTAVPGQFQTSRPAEGKAAAAAEQRYSGNIGEIGDGCLALARRDHKDTLFRMLFRSKENLLSLYNAVNGTAYADPAELEIVTLENAVYMNMKNDQAFLLDFQMNLYEHQSTWNPNMPLRDLFYVAREYQNLVRLQTLYASRLVRIPTPHFIVFYNGTELREESCILKLSDAFQKPSEKPELELLVKVLNINQGNNKNLLDSCRILKEYMIFVEQVRVYARSMDPNQAVERTVDECIQKGILAEFLSRNRAEAIAMSIFEYDEAREKQLMREAEYAEGYDAGIQVGERIGEQRGEEKGVKQGERNKLKELILKKLDRKKTPEEMAEELETELSEIMGLLEEIKAGKQ